jgi:hypothetical protein
MKKGKTQVSNCASIQRKHKHGVFHSVFLARTTVLRFKVAFQDQLFDIIKGMKCRDVIIKI